MLNDRRRALDEISAIVTDEAGRPTPPAVQHVADAIRRRHGDAVVAILFYGSCLRQESLSSTGADSVLDFYALVERYRAAYRQPLAALANRVLPPNVFYLETNWEGGTLRAKYAVIALDQFRRGTSSSSFQSMLWARFSQPCRIVYARDAATRSIACRALSEAVVTSVMRTVPLLPPSFTASDMWIRCFVETYRAELRAERAGRARVLHDAEAARYGRLAPLAIEAAGFRYDHSPPALFTIARGTSAARRRTATIGWFARRIVGKLLSALRVLKNVFTFEDGLRYVLWKIERHSGVRLSVTPWQLRHPLLCAPLLAWRLYRRGAFR